MRSSEWELSEVSFWLMFPVVAGSGGPLKALKSPICGLVSNSDAALRKQTAAASPVQTTEKGRRGVGGRKSSE